MPDNTQQAIDLFRLFRSKKRVKWDDVDHSLSLVEEIASVLKRKARG